MLLTCYQNLLIYGASVGGFELSIYTSMISRDHELHGTPFLHNYICVYLWAERLYSMNEQPFSSTWAVANHLVVIYA